MSNDKPVEEVESIQVTTTEVTVIKYKDGREDVITKQSRGPCTNPTNPGC